MEEFHWNLTPLYVILPCSHSWLNEKKSRYVHLKRLVLNIYIKIKSITKGITRVLLKIRKNYVSKRKAVLKL